MTIGSTISLLPPRIELSLGSPSGSYSNRPVCTANLMPFSIDYDGPAPIDSFLVLRRSAPESMPEQETSAEGAEKHGGSSFLSAFRGRAMQSSQLRLPSGFQAKLVRIEQTVPASSSLPDTISRANDVEENAAKEKERQREHKRRRLERNQPVAMKQQRFSMDSDEDDDDEQDNDAGEISSPATPEPGSPENEELIQETDSPTDAMSTQATGGPLVRISTLAQIADNELRVWGPDGPIDKGDDTFFRTIGEWYTTVAPLLHA